ncbi:transposase [Kitasatospora sp. NPDC004669]|uniref:IS701 family transposase n=1 Tax=Kitasatospora sp. NPDC004669 TaxID=3154555 RepID=UPI0033B804C5
MLTPSLPGSGVSVLGFVERIFDALPRVDQRRWAHVYLRSMLSTPGRKSVRRLAAGAEDAPRVLQSLHQFINGSPWEWAPVRAELAQWTGQGLAARALVIDTAVLRKRGEHSCGVHRRFVPATGRSVTCQVGVGAFLATLEEAVPVDWRLLLPASWTEDAERRERTRIPDEVGRCSVARQALDLVDAVAASGSAPVPVVADFSGEGGAEALVHGLGLRKRDFVVAVPGGLRVTAGGRSGVLPQRSGAAQPAATEARALLPGGRADAAGQSAVVSRAGQSRVVTVLGGTVGLAGAPGGPRQYRLFSVRTPGSRGQARLWLTNLTHARPESLCDLTLHHAVAQRTTARLEADFGLADFEGRSFPGWHHHMTMVSAAYAYQRLGRGAAAEPLAAAG